MRNLPSDENLKVAYYSVLRYVADPFRDEPVNVGLFLVTEDGAWSRFRAHPPKTKLRNVNRRGDVERIERWAANLREVLDVEGSETLFHENREVSIDDLRAWARQFGASLRLTDPKLTAHSDMDALWTTLYRRLVGRQTGGEEKGSATGQATGVSERKRLADALVAEMKTWKNFDKSLVRREQPFPGERLTHVADVAIVNGHVSAIAQALPFSHGTEPELITTRALLVDAALDLSDQVVKLALFDEPAADRITAFRGTIDFLQDTAPTVQLVPRRTFAELQERFAPSLFPIQTADDTGR